MVMAVVVVTVPVMRHLVQRLVDAMLLLDTGGVIAVAGPVGQSRAGQRCRRQQQSGESET